MCPALKNEIFTVGDMLEWKESGSDYVGQRHEKGPFRVVSVEEVPTKCDCGTGDSEHMRGCAALTIKDVGHPQWVVVETKKGKVKFSGDFFLKAKRK